MQRPKKPKDFPLWPHKSGSWCAVVDGERKSFGGWRTDPTGVEAEDRYNKFMTARRLGLEPELALSPVTVKEIVNNYLTRHNKRATKGEIGFRDFRDAVTSLELFTLFVGRMTRIASLKPATFTSFRNWLIDKKKYRPATVKKHLAHIKGMFKWAYDEGHIAAVPRYGADFKAPHQDKRTAPILFSPEEVCVMIAKAPLFLRAMIRLGIEAGMGNTDVAALRWGELDLDKRLAKLVRHKTEEDRRFAISANLVADLKAWKAVQDSREVPREDPDLVFTTLNGKRYVREIPSDVPNGKPRVVDAVAVAFDKLLRRDLKMKRTGFTDGRSFYTLRRTHRTWTDELRDHHAAAIVMGHDFGNMAGVYVQHIDDSRLFAINDHVMNRLKQTESLLRRREKAGDPFVPGPSPHAVAIQKPRGMRGRFAAPSASRSLR